MTKRTAALFYLLCTKSEAIDLFMRCHAGCDREGAIEDMRRFGRFLKTLGSKLENMHFDDLS